MSKQASGRSGGSLGRPAWALILATFATDIGNAMFTVALAALVLGKTGSALVLSGSLMSEYALGFVSLFISVSAIRRWKPRTIMIGTDLTRGVGILACTGMLAVWKTVIPAFAALVVINLMRPFYKSAAFSITPELITDTGLLTRVNGYIATASTAGQIAGAAAVGPVIFWSTPTIAFAVDGVSFLVTSCLFLFLPLVWPQAPAKGTVSPIREWKRIIGMALRFKKLLVHNVLLSGDFVAVSLINLIIIPIAYQFSHNALRLSLLDGGYTVGALLASAFSDRIVDKLGLRTSAVLGLGTQSLCFLSAGLSPDFSPVVAAFSLCGAGSAISLTVFMAQLQIRTDRALRARISVLRQLVVAVVGCIVLPVAGEILDAFGVRAVALTSAAFLAIYVIVFAVLTRPTFWGLRLLQERIVADQGEQQPAAPGRPAERKEVPS